MHVLREKREAQNTLTERKKLENSRNRQRLPRGQATRKIMRVAAVAVVFSFARFRALSKLPEPNRPRRPGSAEFFSPISHFSLLGLSPGKMIGDKHGGARAFLGTTKPIQRRRFQPLGSAELGMQATPSERRRKTHGNIAAALDKRDTPNGPVMAPKLGQCHGRGNETWETIKSPKKKGYRTCKKRSVPAGVPSDFAQASSTWYADATQQHPPAYKSSEFGNRQGPPI